MQVQCPGCSKLLNFPDDRAGQIVRCLYCGSQMQLPGASAPPAAPGVPAAPGEIRIMPPEPPQAVAPGAPAGPTKPCPYCSEPIQASAIKCRHCQTMLSGPGAGKSTAPGAASRYQEDTTGEGKKALILGIIAILCCGVIGGPLAFYYGWRAKDNEGEKGMAVAGMILGVLGFCKDMLAGLMQTLGGMS
jgi:ribosomal protein S27E